MIKPPGFDSTRKYPVLLLHLRRTGRPDRARRVGRQRTYLWHLMLAQQGYIVASIDNSGTASPRGRFWRKRIYGAVGELASREQAAAARDLARRPYVDSTRIGVWGVERRRLDDAQPPLPLAGAVSHRDVRRSRRRPALLRHDLPGALHGAPAAERRRLSTRLTDHVREEPARQPAARPRLRRRQRALPEQRSRSSMPSSRRTSRSR